MMNIIETPKSSRVANQMKPNNGFVPSNFRFGQKPAERVFKFVGAGIPSTEHHPVFARDKKKAATNSLVRHQQQYKSNYLKRRDVRSNGIRYNRRYDLLMKFREEQQLV